MDLGSNPTAYFSFLFFVIFVSRMFLLSYGRFMHAGFLSSQRSSSRYYLSWQVHILVCDTYHCIDHLLLVVRFDSADIQAFIYRASIYSAFDRDSSVIPNLINLKRTFVRFLHRWDYAVVCFQHWIAYTVLVWDSPRIFSSIILCSDFLSSFLHVIPVGNMSDVQYHVTAKYQLAWRCLHRAVPSSSDGETNSRDHALERIIRRGQ